MSFSRVANGVTRFGLGLNAMNGLSLKVPSYKEQLRIAAVLRSADQAIARTEDLIEAKRRLKRGLMQRLFADSTSEVRLARGESRNAS